MLLRRRHDSDEVSAAESTPDGPTTEETPEAPAGNASREEWEAYALENGYTAEDLDGLKRDEIRDLFTDNS